MLWEGISSYLLRRTPSFSELQVFFLIPRCFFFLSQLLPTFFTPSVMGTHLSVFLLFLVLATDGFSSQGNGDDGAFSLSIWTQDSIDGSRGLNSSTLFFFVQVTGTGETSVYFSYYLRGAILSAYMEHGDYIESSDDRTVSVFDTSLGREKRMRYRRQ